MSPVLHLVGCSTRLGSIAVGHHRSSIHLFGVIGAFHLSFALFAFFLLSELYPSLLSSHLVLHFGLQESSLEGLLATRCASFTISNLNCISFTASNIYLLFSAVFKGFYFFLVILFFYLSLSETTSQRSSSRSSRPTQSQEGKRAKAKSRAQSGSASPPPSPKLSETKSEDEEDVSEQAAGGEEAATDRLEEEGETVEEEEEGVPHPQREQSSGANSKLGVVRGKKTYNR